MTQPIRPPSPAEARNTLNPSHVDALAAQLHDLTCRSLWQTQHSTVTIRSVEDPFLHDPRHVELDQARARFLLIGLREDHGLTLASTMDPDGNLTAPTTN